MSKITYHPEYRKHQFVAKAKQMLLKIDKEYGGFDDGQFWCEIKLTGINEIDREEVKWLVEKHMEKCKNQIEKQLLQNKKFHSGDWNEKYQEGFYLPILKQDFQIVEALNNVYQFIWDKYPVKTQRSETFVFTTTDYEDKYNEIHNHLKQNPIKGFKQEYYAILSNKKTRRLFPFTFSAYDLYDATGVYAEFQ